jgi:hypothetical protein
LFFSLSLGIVSTRQLETIVLPSIFPSIVLHLPLSNHCSTFLLFIHIVLLIVS